MDIIEPRLAIKSMTLKTSRIGSAIFPETKQPNCIKQDVHSLDGHSSGIKSFSCTLDKEGSKKIGLHLDRSQVSPTLKVGEVTPA